MSLISICFKLASTILVLLLEMQHRPSNAVLVLGYTREDFPSDFTFGSGTSSYQVEGATTEDGRKPSATDTNAHNGVYGGYSADVACDEYYKYKEDVQLMVDTGLEAYRFSISWPRLIPNGRGVVNPKGVEYYNNLINELVKNGIRPHVTLLHFDYPQALDDAYGGWQNQQIVKDFTSYAEVCFKEFGDRVLHWTTINEINYHAAKMYSKSPYTVGHNLLLAHASAVKLYKEKYQVKQHGLIGIPVYTSLFIPETNAESDQIAANRVRDFETGWIMHPLMFGDYPNQMKKALGRRLPVLTEEESKLVKGSFDFIGVVCYNATIVKDDPFGDSGLCMKAECRGIQYVSGGLMQGVLEHFKHVYGNPPIYIYENGFRTFRNASLLDTSRVDYLNATIGGLLEVLRNGTDVRGYFQWAFMDVFEYIEGYKYGYGLYYVDLNDPNRKRYAKLSAHWYSNFLKGKRFDHNGIIQQMTNSTLYSYPSTISQ